MGRWGMLGGEGVDFIRYFSYFTPRLVIDRSSEIEGTMLVKVDLTGRGENKWLRLRWTYQGQRTNLSLGIPDSPVNRQQAKMIAASIELDFATGRYDHVNYKKNYGLKLKGNKARVIGCVEMFDRFLKTEVIGLSRSGQEKYLTVRSWLERALTVECDRVDISAARNFVARLQERVCGNTVKSYLWILRLCWDWAVRDYDVVSPNPWAVVLLKVRGSQEKRAIAFTEEEVELILKTFREHPTYNYYSNFIKFLVSIAARPGEVSPLVWADVAKDFSSVSINKSHGKGITRNTTKNNKSREVWLPEAIIEMLRTLHQEKNPSPKDLVFPAPKGGKIDTHSFSSRIWTQILVIAGLPHQKFYTLRHTGISHALAQGAVPMEVAEQVGNSLRVLTDTYSHPVSRRSPFKGF